MKNVNNAKNEQRKVRINPDSLYFHMETIVLINLLACQRKPILCEYLSVQTVGTSLTLEVSIS